MFEELKALVDSSAGEREIQSLLKDDLSFIGNTHSAKTDEFIAFSEFPLGKGKIDFVVFTSRSKMQIKFIEIKGADFSFTNVDGTVANDIKRAAEKIMERFDVVEKAYENFRREAHILRKQVEGGKVIYNSVIGKSGELYCDSEKEILVSGVVIGGKTTDDLVESNRKAQMQKHGFPLISFESWDSFLRKIEDKENAPKIYDVFVRRKNLTQIQPHPVGQRVSNLVKFSGVPEGTKGIVDEHWQSSDGIGIMVAWDLPDQPLPAEYRCYEVGQKINVLRDGFLPHEFKDLRSI